MVKTVFADWDMVFPYGLLFNSDYNLLYTLQDYGVSVIETGNWTRELIVGTDGPPGNNPVATDGPFNNATFKC